LVFTAPNPFRTERSISMKMVRNPAGFA
jgi:hypothetical protein